MDKKIWVCGKDVIPFFGYLLENQFILHFSFSKRGVTTTKLIHWNEKNICNGGGGIDKIVESGGCSQIFLPKIITFGQVW